jgi:hypothetical protein
MTVKYTYSFASPQAAIKGYGGGVVAVTWASLKDDSVPGDGFQAANWVASSFQVVGTFGVGGSISLEGSNDGTNWAVVPDINGNPATLTASGGPGIVFLAESPIWLRANVTAGDETTDLTAIVALRRQPNNGG